MNEFAGRGFRSLGVARADEEGNWQFAGVLPIFDPPREQAKATIASARQMGVDVKMVTGDQIAIAHETAKQLGLGPISSMPVVWATRSNKSGAVLGGHRKGGRLRPGVSGTQVPHCRSAAEAGPLRRDDRRRRERCSRAEEGGLRHRRFRRDRRGPRGSVHRAARIGPVGDHRRRSRRAAEFSSG